jgi:hypothetical protein
LQDKKRSLSVQRFILLETLNTAIFYQHPGGRERL